MSKLIESDELHYLRWCYQNLNLYVEINTDKEWAHVERFVDRRAMNAAYEDQTGRAVPHDYVVQ